jgi:hypothetical protein
MEIRTLNPAEANVQFHVTVDHPNNRLGVKGRLVGPRCAYASTVEVAYPLKDAPPSEPGRLSTRVIIPEPNLWEPACPFLYEATLELFLDRSRIDVRTMIVGLRTITIRGSSFFLNGKRFELKTMEAVHLAESGLAQARKQFNTVVLPVSLDVRPLWHACDHMGLGVLGLVLHQSQSVPEHFADHACLLGWLVDDKRLATDRADLQKACVPLGLQIPNDSAYTNPLATDFVVVPGRASEQLQKWGMPVIELTPNP